MQKNLSQRQRRIRFERESLGICLPAGQRNWFQNTIKIENKSRSYKVRSDERHGSFWNKWCFFQDMLRSKTDQSAISIPPSPTPNPCSAAANPECFEFPPSRMTANPACHAL